MFSLVLYMLMVLFAYMMGNISSSYVISKTFYGVDIRTKGSKNAGTTNALRTFGFKAGLLTFLGDLLKGTIAVLVVIFVATQFDLDVDLSKYIAALAVVCGHNWPVLLKFRGGKGVATTYGAMLAIAPLPTLFSMLFFIVIVIVTKYVSVASIFGVMLFPVLMYIKDDFSGVWITIILSFLVIYKHRENIKRLIQGNENRLDLKKKNNNGR